MSSDRRPIALLGLLGAAVITTVVTHLVYVAQHLPEQGGDGVPYVLAGWLSFAFVFYALGRLATTADSLPSMRTGDAGVGLVLASLLLAGALDAFGFELGTVPEAYVLPAIGLYVGLALLGWSLGRRTAAINRIAAED